MFYTIFDENKIIMKNKNQFKKLVLNKETVTVLNENQQRMLVGGGATDTDTTTTTNQQSTIIVTTLKTKSGSKTGQN